jgi:hypothetical protein
VHGVVEDRKRPRTERQDERVVRDRVADGDDDAPPLRIDRGDLGRHVSEPDLG